MEPNNLELEKRIRDLEEDNSEMKDIIHALIASGRYTIQRDLQIFDGRNIQLALGTGTKIGTATTQKLAFHGSTPAIQRAGTGGNQDALSTTAATQTTPWGYASQAQADGLISRVNEIRATLVEKGLMKGSNA